MRIFPTKRGWKRLGIALAILVGFVLAANGVVAWWVDYQFQSRVAAIRAAGDPASLADLTPPPIPPEKNAAAILESIRPRLDEFGDDHWKFLDQTELGKDLQARRERNEPPTAEQIEAIREVLDKYPDLDTQLAAAAACNQYASVTDYTAASPELLDQFILPKLQTFRTASRYLDWRIQVLNAESKPDEAVRRGIELLVLARMHDREPTLVCNLVALAVRGIAINALYDVLASSTISPETHAALEAELALHEDPQRMLYVLKSERAFGIDNHMRRPPQAIEPPVWVFHMFGWPLKRYWIGVLDYFDEELKMVQRPWPDGRSWVGRRPRPDAPSGHGVLADLLIPATQAAYDANARTTAMLRTLRVFNALTEFRQKHGHEATGFADLKLPKEATLDPFSGKPLLLKHTDDGWLIYSVGTNRTDDGGNFADQKDHGLGPRKNP